MANSTVTDWETAEFWARSRTEMTSAYALPPAVYADEDFFGSEQVRLFGRAWVGVALAAEVAQPGRLLVRSVGGRSVLLTRSDAGLGGFLNSCRHRGTELAEADCDIANTIRCPYHRWHYSADGQLVAAPFFDEVPREDFDMTDYGLIPIRTEVWGPLVFVSLDADAPPLRIWLGDLPERLAAYDFENWGPASVPGGSRTFDVAANWKLLAENFAEYYHLPWVHPELAKVSRVPDHYRYQGPGMYCGQTTTPVSGEERDDWLTLPPAAGLDDSDAASGRFVALFPNVTLAVLPSHMFLMRLEPLSAGRTLEHCTFLFPPGPMTDAEPSAELRESFEITRRFWIEVNDEDIDICERAQRGISAGGAPPGPLAPRFEEPLNRFHKMTADLMTLPSLAELEIPRGDRPGSVDLFGSEPNPVPPAIERIQASTATGRS
ncbi:aromatic ring-hydroxylating oxygenase subunit alpha [Candidatus Poriferisodalis sp.]|uniref:aromatic ring-hydroxylating oxygenase subunit alpha n=1 Tax=Candidatus Poriferisodalis sp. TaxID=3101277 RepID=UPI003B02BC25